MTLVWDKGSWCVLLVLFFGRQKSSFWTKPRQQLTWKRMNSSRTPSKRNSRTAQFWPLPIDSTLSFTMTGNSGLLGKWERVCRIGKEQEKTGILLQANRNPWLNSLCIKHCFLFVFNVMLWRNIDGFEKNLTCIQDSSYIMICYK